VAKTDEKQRGQICLTTARILREERERQAFSMSAVAERAGLSQQMVSYVERGLRNPTLDTLVRITQAMGLSLPDVISRAYTESAKAEAVAAGKTQKPVR